MVKFCPTTRKVIFIFDVFILAQVSDKVGNARTVRTWVLLDSSSTITATEHPVALSIAEQHSGYAFTHDNTSPNVTYTWAGNFINNVITDY